MDKLKEYQFLRKETKKLNDFLFGPFSYEQSLKTHLNKDSIYTKSILNLAKNGDNHINKGFPNNKKMKSLQKSKTLLK